MKKTTIGSIRVEERTLVNMKSAIIKYNEKNMFAITEAEFRRLSYILLSQLILQDKTIPIKLR